MSKGNVLSLFDWSANMVRPWAENGYACYCYDIKHEGSGTIELFEGGGSIHKWHADMRLMDPDLTPFKPCIVFAFPPCTDLAVSGALHFKGKGMQRLIDGLQLVENARVACEHYGAPYMIENPVSTLSTYWRKPDHIFNPCDYGGYLNPPGDEYTKKTCIWQGNGFVMPEYKPVAPVKGSKMWKLPPSEDRAEIRSTTPAGFARAVYESNKG